MEQRGLIVEDTGVQSVSFLQHLQSFAIKNAIVCILLLQWIVFSDLVRIAQIVQSIGIVYQEEIWKCS